MAVATLSDRHCDSGSAAGVNNSTSIVASMADSVVRDSYTGVSDTYTRMFGAVARVHPDDLRFLERHLGRCDGAILDAGCGPGHLTKYLTVQGLAATGLDLVPAFIESARANWP